MLLLRPKFWQDISIISLILLPFSFIYYIALIIKNRRRAKVQLANAKKSRIPIIVVGNIVVGGTGKTPMVKTIADFCLKENLKPIILTKGWGRKIKGEIGIVTGDMNYNAKQIGDEAKMLSLHHDVYITENRFEAIKKIRNYDVIICDDGLHDLTFIPSLKLCLFDGEYGIGNGLYLPAGPIRSLLPRNCFKVIVGNDLYNLKKNYPNRLDVAISIKHKIRSKCLAFAAIGNPHKFFTMLTRSGCDVRLSRSFPDHYLYKEKDIENLILLAKKRNLQLVTTSKDYVKLSPRQKSNVIEVELIMELPNELKKLIKDVTNKKNFSRIK